MKGIRDRLVNKIPFVMKNTKENLYSLLPLCTELGITWTSGRGAEEIDCSGDSHKSHVVVGGELTGGAYKLTFATLGRKKTFLH